MRAEPYLYFNGRCEEAIIFYQSAVGAELVELVRFRDAPTVPAPAGADDKIMHALLRIGESRLLLSDGPCRGRTCFQGFSLAVWVKEDEEAERIFRALVRGGQVQIPLKTTSFASTFGMAADPFGVLWTIST
jgi:PhnB protein